MPDDKRSPFAERGFIFNANAAALGTRLRRPKDFIQTEGSVSLTGIGGQDARDRKKKCVLEGASVSAASYQVGVSGDYVDLKAAARLTASSGGQRSAWSTNSLPIRTGARCAVQGFQAVNFTDARRRNGPTLKIGSFEFDMEAINDRSPDSELSVTFKKLDFSEVSINGVALKISTLRSVHNKLTTFSALQQAYSGVEFRRSFGHTFYRPHEWPAETLFAKRGYCLATVVNKIEWANKKEAIAGVEIAGHSVFVPDFGTIYFGEMTVSPLQKRIHMVRGEFGCPDGGGFEGGTGCQNGHPYP